MNHAIRVPARSVCRSLSTLLLLACGEAGGGEDETAEGVADAAGRVMAAGGSSGADTFTSGLERLGDAGKLGLTFRTATPAPPQRGLNDWTVSVSDSHGLAVAGCQLDVGLFMPAHGHSAPKAPVVSPGAGAESGTYAVADANFFMPGLWEVTFDLTCGTVTDQVKFAFEIAR